jgi:HEAT repeat protein
MFAARAGIKAQPAVASTTVDTAIREVAADANSDTTGIVASMGVKHANAENLLLRRLPNASPHDRQAIAKLLAVCGSQRSVPALLRVAEKEVAPSGALAAIEQIVGIDGLAQTVGGSKDPTVRSDLMVRLLRAGSQEGLIGFLSLVHNDSTRAEALSIVKGMSEVPIPELITLLDHGDEHVRLAAAVTLGHINGPKTTELLINRVTEQPANSPEAWIALMSCRGDRARDFLAYATHRPQLLGYYNNARVHWAQRIQ